MSRITIGRAVRFGCLLGGTLLVLAGAVRAEPVAPKRAATEQAKAAKPSGAPTPAAALADERLIVPFLSLPPQFDPARRNDLAFVPRIDRDAVSAVAATRVIAAEAEAIGDRATAVTASMLTAHVLRLHATAEAERLLETAIAEATKAGWSDREMRTALHDLAAILAARGDPRAAGLEARASRCPRPCATDRPTRLYARGRALVAGQDRTTSDVPIGERLAALRAVRPWLRETLGATSPWYRIYLSAREAEFEDARPFTALDLARERLAEVEEPAQRADRLISFAYSLRRAGDYREAAERAAEAATLFDGLGRTGEARLARWDETMARLRLGDADAKERLRATAADLTALLVARNDLSLLRALAYDLVGAHLWDEADPVLAAIVPRSAGLWASGRSMGGAALAGRARIAMRAGRYEAAETLLDQAEAAMPKQTGPEGGVTAIALLAERATLEDARGRAEEARRLRERVRAALSGSFEEESASTVMSVMTMMRDFGGIDGGGVLAEILAGLVDREAGDRPSYQTAQHLWQIAYSLALAGRAEPAFERMTRAAAIAVRHSFESVDDTDGGSLQLMRRDRWRYLLFVDIAWSAARKRPPEEMTVPARY